MRFRNAARFALLIALGLATGCAGGASHAPPKAASSPSTGTSATSKHTAQFTLSIPRRSSASRSKRSPAYVSASTQSGVLTITPTDGIPQSYTFNFNNNSSFCTTNVQTGIETCALNVPVVIGTNTASLTLYDQQNGSGSPLSAASNFVFMVTEGESNVTVPLVLGGIPASATLTQSVPPNSYTVGATGTMVLTAKDADGNTIIAPGGYNDENGNPVPITLTAANSTIKLSLSGGSNPTTSVSVSDPTQVITSVVETSGIVGGEVFVSGAATLGSPGYVSVFNSPAADSDTVPSAQSLGGPLQGTLSGEIAGAYDNDVYVVNGTSVTGCFQGVTPIDAIDVPSSALFFVYPSSESSVLFDATGLTSTFTPCTASVASNDESSGTTVSYGTAGVLNGYLLAVQQDTLSPGDCDIYAQKLPNGTYGPVGSEGPGPVGGGNASAFLCSGSPYDLTFDPYGSQNAAAFGYTSSNDDVGFFTGYAFSSLSSVGFALPPGTLGGVAIRDDMIYAIDAGSSVLRTYDVVTGQIQSFGMTTSPGCLIPAANGTRTFVVGDDGTGYLVVGGSNCASPGLLQINLSTGATIATISGAAVTSVATDYNGHIYYDVDATNTLYRYPSVTAPTAHARRLPPNNGPAARR